MKKFLISMLIFVGLLGPAFVLPATAGAVDVSPVCQQGAGSTEFCAENKKTGNPVIHILQIVLEIIAIIIGFAAVVMVIIGGIKLTMSNGDPSSVKSGRDTVIYALIGIVVALLAQGIVSFVLNKI